MYLYSHTNRVYSDSLRVTAATVDNSRSLYVLYGLLSTRITAFDLSQFPCVWISNELFIIRGFTSINDFTNKNDFEQLKKRFFFILFFEDFVFSPLFYYVFFFIRRKVNKIYSIEYPSFFFYRRVHWYAWWNPTNIDSAELKRGHLNMFPSIYKWKRTNKNSHIER